MIRINCQFAAVLQGKLTVLLCIVEDTNTQAVCLNLMLTASQYVFYDFSMCSMTLTVFGPTVIAFLVK